MTTLTSPASSFTATRIATLLGLNQPTEEQRRVIEAPLKPLLVVAGAGSGKTETMSRRVLWAVAHQGIPAQSILGLTFSRKAAAELGGRLQERLDQLSPHVEHPVEGNPTATTYNAFAQQIVTDYGLRIGLNPDVTLLGQAAAVQLMTDIFLHHGALPDVFTDRSLVNTIKDALALANHLSEHGLTVDQAREKLQELSGHWAQLGKLTSRLADHEATNQRRLALLDYVAAFEHAKRERGVIDFGDQLAIANQIVHRVPEVVEQLRATYQVVMLDEFQDTSVIQMDVFSTLFHDHPVTAVGDPNQAIYGWRGASAASLETFLQRFHSGEPAPQQSLTLSTAWRNDRMILDVANRVAAPLLTSEAADLRVTMPQVTVGTPTLHARPHAGQGLVDVVYETDRQGEAAAVAQFIQKHRIQVDGQWTTAAVLCRKRDLIQPIDRALRDIGIPTQVMSSDGLLDQPAVSDVRAALELSVDVGNSPWLARLIAALDLGAADQMLLYQWSRHVAASRPGEHPKAVLLDAVDSPPPAGWQPRRTGPAFSQAGHERIRALGHKLRLIRAGAGQGVVQQVERAIRILGVIPDIIADPLRNSGQADLDQFVTIAAQYESDIPQATMSGFLQWLALAEDEERGLSLAAVDPEPGAVQILTVHASKGLEWATVAVAGLGEGVFPQYRSKQVPWSDPVGGANEWLTAAKELPYPLRGDAAALPEYDPWSYASKASEYNNWVLDFAKAMGRFHEREERRLAYVAFTRAQRHLLLAGSWMSHGKQVGPSRYLMDPLTAGLTQTGIDQSGAATPPDPDTYHDASADGVTYPVQPGPTRVTAAQLAAQVQATIQELQTVTDRRSYLSGLADGLDAECRHRLVEDTLALLQERDDDRLRRTVTVNADQIPATGIAALLEQPQQWALNARRPMPVKPSGAENVGTLFHSWVEQQLRMASATLFDEDLPGAGALTARQRQQMEEAQRGFISLDFAGRGWVPIAVEHPFSTTIGDVTVQGRMDAVFQAPGAAMNSKTSGASAYSNAPNNASDTLVKDSNESHIVIVDWKTGRRPDPRTELGRRTLWSHAVQLLVYRRAWADYAGVEERSIDVEVAYVRDQVELHVEHIQQELGNAIDLEARMATVVGWSRLSSGKQGDGERE